MIYIIKKTYNLGDLFNIYVAIYLGFDYEVVKINEKNWTGINNDNPYYHLFIFNNILLLMITNKYIIISLHSKFL